MVTALPGRSGVTFDYEGLSQNQDYPRPHAEHAVLGRTSSGPALYTAHIHGGGAWGRSSVDGATRDRARLLRGGRRCVTVPVGDTHRGAVDRPPHLYVVLRRTRRRARDAQHRRRHAGRLTLIDTTARASSAQRSAVSPNLAPSRLASAEHRPSGPPIRENAS